MSRWAHYNDGNFAIDVDFRDDLTTVSIRDLLTGQSARGNALRNIDDTYNEKIGIQLAHARALSRLYRKNEKYWIKKTEPVEY